MSTNSWGLYRNISNLTKHTEKMDWKQFSFKGNWQTKKTQEQRERRKENSPASEVSSESWPIRDTVSTSRRFDNKWKWTIHNYAYCWLSKYVQGSSKVWERGMKEQETERKGQIKSCKSIRATQRVTATSILVPCSCLWIFCTAKTLTVHIVEKKTRLLFPTLCICSQNNHKLQLSLTDKSFVSLSS